MFLITLYCLHMTQELERTPRLCFSGAGTFTSPSPKAWPILSITAFLSSHWGTMWKTNTVMAHTGLTQLVKAGNRDGRWDQKPLKEQEIQGWFHRWFLIQDGQRAFPKRQTGLGMQKTIRGICFLICTSTLLSGTEGKNKVQVLFSHCDYLSDSCAF